jgi:hypothetical protein
MQPTLIEASATAILGMEAQVKIEATGNDTGRALADALNPEIRRAVRACISLPATTPAEFQAKAKLFRALDHNHDDLAKSITRDIMALS